jgi:hypothetical protein
MMMPSGHVRKGIQGMKSKASQMARHPDTASGGLWSVMRFEAIGGGVVGVA